MGTEIFEKKIKIIYKDEENYPKLLKEIHDPPKQLYCIGDLSLLKKKTIGVVGSRKATDYGIWVAKTLGKRLGENHVTVVSGMAKGIDMYSHIGALSVRGGTVAVMGCGIDICYPASNKTLWEEIARKGLIISEYPPGMSAKKYTFPMRNRIISGLSLATVVVEAGIQSGSLITAELAADQGRSVYAVPGNINNANSLGTNKLLRDGAMPLVILDDLLEDLNIEKKGAEKECADLSPLEQSVYRILEKEGELTIDELCYKAKKDAATVNGLVTVLEMKGKIYMSLGKVFVAKI